MTAPLGAAAFDLDGCIVDSVGAILPSVHVAMAECGLASLPDGELMWLIGPPLLTGFEQLLVRLGRDPFDASALLEAYRAVYRVTMFERTTVFPGMADALAAIAAARPICVVTSKPVDLARPLLEHLGLASRMQLIEGPALDRGDEPKTETLRRAMQQLEIAVMVGDRHHDIEAGQAHGTETVGVTWGIGSPTELGGADHVVSAPGDLIALLAPPLNLPAGRQANPSRP